MPSKRRKNYFDSSLVLGECMQWCGVGEGAARLGIPDVQEIVVASTGQELPVRGPLQSTHFLGVAKKCPYLVLSHTHIMMVNGSATRTTEEKTGRFRDFIIVSSVIELIKPKL